MIFTLGRFLTDSVNKVACSNNLRCQKHLFGTLHVHIRIRPFDFWVVGGEAAMYNYNFVVSFLYVSALQAVCNAKAVQYGYGSSNGVSNPFLDHYASLFDDSSLLNPKRSSVFDTDPFFTSSSSSLFPSRSLFDSTSSPFSDFDSQFGSTYTKPSTVTSEDDGDDYNRRTKQSSRNGYSSTSTHTIYVGVTNPKSFGSLSPYASTYPSPSSKPVASPSVGKDDHSDESNSDNDSDDEHKKPNPSLENAAALATGAAAGAAAFSSLRNRPAQNQNQPPVGGTAPNPQNQQQPRNNEVKCNWCIRPNCNPGGCQDAPNFDPKKDAEALHRAVKGAGTNERVLIDILTHRSEKQIKKIRQEYQEFDKGLDTDVADDTSFKTKDLLMALLQPRAVYFAEQLNKAFKKDDNSAMIMILTSLSPCAVKKVGAAYVLKYGKALADDIKEASAQNFEDFLVKLARGNRKQDGPVDTDQAKKDAQALYNAGPKKWFVSDKSVFIDIFTQRSYSQLRQIIKEYDDMRKPQKSNLWKDIADNTSDKLQQGLMAMMRNVQDQPGYFADELEGSLDKLLGPGVRDNEKLIRIMRGRCGIDLGDIRDAYPKNHNGKKLADRLAKKTVMDYEEALLAMLDQPKAQSQSQRQKQ